MKSRVHYKDRIGQKFGRLTIIQYVSKNDNRGYYLCKCECGNEKIVSATNLIKGDINSCGCLARELTIKRNIENKYTKKHGKSKTRLYQIWLDIKQRCYNTKQNTYKWYGAKGIKMCDEWFNDYLEFEKWSLSNGYKENLTIDRINSKCNYEPNNCRWITMKQQLRNTSRTILITYNGKTQCLKDWCNDLGKNYQTIHGRIYTGWQPKIALLVPYNIRKGSKKYYEIVNSIS